jgi:drug/metabolite transporter (DMT)-like permease
MGFTQKQKAYAALAVTCIGWGTTWVVSKIAVQGAPGLQVSCIRQFIAGSVLLLFFTFKKETLPNKQQFIWLLISSLFLVVFNSGLTTWSIKYIPSGLAALIGALSPLFVVIFEMLFLKSKNYNLLTFGGLLTGIIGIAIVFYENAFHQHPAGYVFGLVLCFAGIISWAVGTILIARNKYQMNPYYALGWQLFLAGIMLYFLANATGNFIAVSSIPAKTWIAISYLVILGSLITFIAFIYSIKHLSPALASLYAYINPIVAILIGSVVFNERLTFNILVGSIITLAGVYMVNQSLKKR